MPSPIPQPPRDEVAEEDLAIYDDIVARFQRLREDRPNELRGPDDAGYYRGALLNSPPWAAAVDALSRLARTSGDRGGSYSHTDRELVDQVLCADFGTNQVLRTHIADGLAAGMRIELVEAFRYGREEDLTDDERLLATYVRQVVGGTVDDETRDAIEQRLGRRGLVEYTIFIAYLQMVIRLQQAVGVPAPSDEEIDTMISEFREGTRELPDYRMRIR